MLRPAVGRASVVLDVMVETGALTAAQAAAASPAEVKLAAAPKQNSVRYFTDWALPQLEVLIDETVAPLDVWTTIDLKMQNAATQAIQANTPKGAQGALVSLDRDGAVRAMVGGRDYVSSIYNRATQATRQPGSAFKLFVYLAALEAGHKVEDRVVDEPVTINGWSPRNNSGRFSGEMTLRSAFAYSINTVAAKLGAGNRIRDRCRHGTALWRHDADQYPAGDGARHLQRPPDRHDPRLRLGRAKGRGSHPLCHHPRHRERRSDLPA
jgi:penicillin-binding protein 1A